MTEQNDNYLPRRARTPWYGSWPRWLVLVAVTLVACLLTLVVGYYARGNIDPLTTVIPQPGPTWTTYIPEMPSECAEMLDAADTLYDTSTTNEQQLLALAKLAVDGAQQGSASKLIAAGKTAEKAQKLTPKLKIAREKFLDAYRKCAEA